MPAGLRTVGLAYVDPGARVLRTVEFTDDDHFNHLESALVQLGVRECALVKVRDRGGGERPLDGVQQLGRRLSSDILRCALSPPPWLQPTMRRCALFYATTLFPTPPPPAWQDKASEAGQPGAQSLDMQRVVDVLTRTGAAPAPRPRPSFSVRNLDQDLQRLLLPGSLERHRHVLEGHHASAALAGVLSFGELLADGSGHGKYGLDRLDLGKFMRMDAAAQVRVCLEAASSPK